MVNNGPAPSEEGYELVGARVSIFLRGRIWQANFQHAGLQERRSLKTTSKKEARRRALQIDGELDTGRWEAEVKSASVAETVDAYMNFLRAEGRAKKTLVKYQHVFKRVVELAEARHVVS